jgi:Asp-tRNA(Asn)/Glu-tRNA(Gln) amidotransferase A subunit family amidase
MPIGIQIIAKPYDDYRLLMFGNYLEKYHKKDHPLTILKS